MPGIVLQACIVAGVAAGSAWLWLQLQEAAWPRTDTNRQAEEAAASPARPANWIVLEKASRDVTVARRTDGGIPVPERTREFFPQTRHGRHGVSFQALYETPLAPEAVAGFYYRHLPPEGWRVDRAAAGRLGETTDSAAHLVFRRPGQHLIISLYRGKRGTGSEFRISLVARPQ